MPKETKRSMTKYVVVRPILSKEFSSRGQVDLIDMQSMPSGSNKNKSWCTSKRAAEVAFHLLDILFLFDSPVIFQSDNGYELTSQANTELKEVRQN
ncbi:KRAB-A domain-containing protein 2 [Plakobranchus ocellatus]|uniref:KRAB-A domain-containing protein 2 n=1 Tax=Plakobranchus ocellatus TaxID=259542 RepID=A0AAV3Y979_9GAST|nr:KRAB-A domain-containing protein 2 [Plakobranchus ocellatus]